MNYNCYDVACWGGGLIRWVWYLVVRVELLQQEDVPMAEVCAQLLPLSFSMYVPTKDAEGCRNVFFLWVCLVWFSFLMLWVWMHIFSVGVSKNFSFVLVSRAG